MRNLIDGIEIGASLFIPFTFNREMIIATLTGAGIDVRDEEEGRLIVSSVLFRCAVRAAIVFCFSGDCLSCVGIAPMLEGDDDYETFSRVQRKLRGILGAPAYTIGRTLNWMGKRNRLYRWRTSQSEITHCLEDRFGLTETISIRFAAASHAPEM